MYFWPVVKSISFFSFVPGAREALSFTFRVGCARKQCIREPVRWTLYLHFQELVFDAWPPKKHFLSLSANFPQDVNLWDYFETPLFFTVDRYLRSQSNMWCACSALQFQSSTISFRSGLENRLVRVMPLQLSASASWAWLMSTGVWNEHEIKPLKGFLIILEITLLAKWAGTTMYSITIWLGAGNVTKGEGVLWIPCIKCISYYVFHFNWCWTHCYS